MNQARTAPRPRARMTRRALTGAAWTLAWTLVWGSMLMMFANRDHAAPRRTIAAAAAAGGVVR